MSQLKTLPEKKRIALVAHDGCKDDLLKWVKQNKDALEKHELFGTGGTGKLIAKQTGLKVNRFMSGPLGGDQQIGAAIATGELDILIFFWDPLQPQPHDPDVKALLRLAVLHNIPTASNVATADFIIGSPHIGKEYKREMPDYSKELEEKRDDD